MISGIMKPLLLFMNFLLKDVPEDKQKLFRALFLGILSVTIMIIGLVEVMFEWAGRKHVLIIIGCAGMVLTTLHYIFVEGPKDIEVKKRLDNALLYLEELRQNPSPERTTQIYVELGMLLKALEYSIPKKAKEMGSSREW